MTDQVHVHSPAPTAASTEVRLVTVERDVAGLKGDITKLEGSVTAGFKELVSKVDSKGSTNWTVVGLVLGAVFTVAGWGFALFGNFQGRTNDDIAGLKQMISAGIAEQKATAVAIQADAKASLATLAAAQKAGDDALASELKTQSSNFISRPDLIDKFQTAKEKRDAQQAATDKRIERVESDLADLKKEVVPYGTHVQQWAHQNSLNDLHQKQIDELRAKNDALFNGRDEIQRLVHRLDKLDDVARPAK